MQFSGGKRCYFGWLFFLWFDPKSINVSGASFILKGQHAQKGLQDQAELLGQMYLSGYYEEFYEFLVKKFSKALPKALADKKKKKINLRFLNFCFKIILECC